MITLSVITLSGFHCTNKNRKKGICLQNTNSNKIHYQSALLNEQIQPKIRKLLRVNSKLRESLKLREDHVTQFIKEMNCIIAKKEHERVKYSPRGQETNRRMF